MTLETLQLLRQMLANQQLSVGAPDFAETARQVIQAISELDEAIAAAAPEPIVE